MNVYVESNFVLKLALLRDEHESCAQLLELARAGDIHLFLPAFSVGEPYEALVRRTKQRTELQKNLVREINELARSQPDQAVVTSSSLLRSCCCAVHRMRKIV